MLRGRPDPDSAVSMDRVRAGIDRLSSSFCKRDRMLLKNSFGGKAEVGERKNVVVVIVVVVVVVKRRGEDGFAQIFTF